MTTRKRNEFLDLESEDDDRLSGYDSSAAGEIESSRVDALPSAHISKRRKLPRAIPSSCTSESEAESVPYVTRKQQPQIPDHPDSVHQTLATRTNDSPSSALDTTPPPIPITKPLNPSPLPLKAANASAHSRGVIYLSRIPPFMRPSTVRSLLSQHGPITRLFLTPEPPSSYLGRRARGGNKKKSYIDGWVEFTSRRDARVCAAAINTQTIGRKAGFYGNDVWNARFLKGFTWTDLMAGARAEEREREERVRVGLGREARERKAFLNGVERGRRDVARRERRKGKGKEGDGTEQDVMTPRKEEPDFNTADRPPTPATVPPPSTNLIPSITTTAVTNPTPKPPRSSEMRFRQHAPVPAPAHRTTTTTHPSRTSTNDNMVNRVLRQIF